MIINAKHSGAAPGRDTVPGLVPATGNAEEENLLRRSAARDRQAFERLYRLYHPRLERFLVRVTPRRDLIEEVINDTLLVVWRKAADFKGQSQVSTWIMGIAYRCALKALRGPNGHQPQECPLDESLQHLAVEGPLPGHERRDWVGKGLRHLPVEQIATLQLAYHFGYSCEEIGDIMGCPVSTVKARMFHARVKLRNLLPDLGGYSGSGASHEQG